MSYLNHRQNCLVGIPVGEVEEALSMVAQKFEISWLQEKGSHPLQILWSRRDALATNELYAFGKSLIAAQRASASWLGKQIKIVKGRDENNARGAIFEILVIGFVSPDQKVTPAPFNQQGYDIDIESQAGSVFRSSLKRHSLSSHERLFLKKAEHARDLFVERLGVLRQSAQIYVESISYPGESDWQLLYQEVRKFEMFSGAARAFEVSGKWRIVVTGSFPEVRDRYWTEAISYTFVCVSPFHGNEQRNFLSKLDAAVSNLERHVKSGADHIPSVIMLVPASASVQSLRSWTRDYFESNKSSSLEIVVFLQPYLSSKPDMSTSVIAYFATTESSERFRSRLGRKLSFQFPVGEVSNNPPEWRIISNSGQEILSECYAYQAGKHYLLADRDESGGVSAHVKRVAPGIQQIAVFSLGGQETCFSGHWGEELCLIGE